VDVDLARQNVTAARLRLESARSAEGLLVVRAPTAGTVTSVAVAPGATVDPTTVIATVDALDRLVVTVDLSEFDVAQVRPGQKAVIEVDALGGEPFGGAVLFVAPTATDTGGVVTFPVLVGMNDAPQVLKPGMNVSVRIIAARHRNVVQVPLEAVSRDDEDRPYVTTVDDSGQQRIRRVKLGIANAERVEIVSGLRAGENVVLAQQAPEEE
jgi:HlyD family secretion protein